MLPSMAKRTSADIIKFRSWSWSNYLGLFVWSLHVITAVHWGQFTAEAEEATWWQKQPAMMHSEDRRRGHKPRSFSFKETLEGHPSAPAPSTLSHASNLDWRSISHMIIYTFQCYSLKSSHPPERWDGEGGGRRVQDGEHMYTHGWFMSVYGKNHHNIVK